MHPFALFFVWTYTLMSNFHYLWLGLDSRKKFNPVEYLFLLQIDFDFNMSMNYTENNLTEYAMYSL